MVVLIITDCHGNTGGRESRAEAATLRPQNTTTSQQQQRDTAQVSDVKLWSFPHNFILLVLLSDLVAGGVCQGMCRGDVLSNYKPRAGQVTIHQAVSALCCHDDQLMIPVSSTLSSAPHLTLQWLVVSGAAEKIV